MEELLAELGGLWWQSVREILPKSDAALRGCIGFRFSMEELLAELGGLWWQSVRE